MNVDIPGRVFSNLELVFPLAVLLARITYLCILCFEGISYDLHTVFRCWQGRRCGRFSDERPKDSTWTKSECMQKSSVQVARPRNPKHAENTSTTYAGYQESTVEVHTTTVEAGGQTQRRSTLIRHPVANPDVTWVFKRGCIPGITEDRPTPIVYWKEERCS